MQITVISVMLALLAPAPLPKETKPIEREELFGEWEISVKPTFYKGWKVALCKDGCSCSWSSINNYPKLQGTWELDGNVLSVSENSYYGKKNWSVILTRTKKGIVGEGDEWVINREKKEK